MKDMQRWNHSEGPMMPDARLGPFCEPLGALWDRLSINQLTIIGAGTYGAVIAELAAECGYTVERFLDDNDEIRGKMLLGAEVSGPVEGALQRLPRGTAVAVALGDNNLRLKYLRLARAYGLSTPSLISPGATVSPTAIVDQGVFLHHGSHVWTEARLGLGTILSPHATVAHHTTLGEGCFVSTAANVGANINVGATAMFGINSTTSTGVAQIGEGTLVGAGATIIRDTEPGGVYVGNPGRLIRYRTVRASKDAPHE